MTTTTDTPERVVVVGGGLAGTAAVARLLEEPDIANVVWIEAENRWGGRVDTVLRDDLAIELGAAFALDPALFASGDHPRDPSDVDDDVIVTALEQIGFVADGILHRDRTVEGCLSSHLGTEAFAEIFGFGSPIGARLLAAAAKETNDETLTPSNPFGDVSQLSPRTAEAIGAFFGLIHPGRFDDTTRIHAPTALTAWPCSRRERGNADRLRHWRDDLLERHGPTGRLTTRLGWRVRRLEEYHDRVRVDLVSTVASADATPGTESLEASAVILATTTTAIRDLGVDCAPEHRAFYTAATYHPGLVVGFTARRGPNPVRYAVSVDEPWNSVILGASDPGADDVEGADSSTIPNRVAVQVYLAQQRAHEAWGRRDDEIVAEMARSLERLGIVADVDIETAVVRRWREIGPGITPQLATCWRPGHRRLTSRIVFGGELAAFDGRRAGYGTASAVAGGRLAAEDVIATRHQRSDSDGDAASSTEFVLDPLLEVHVYRIGGYRPELVSRRREGDVAFHGLVLAAEPTTRRADALWAAQSPEGLWEFQRGFHPTLEDSCLVLEGLGCDPTLDDPHRGPSRHRDWTEAVGRLVDAFADEDTGLWTTTHGGRSRYWRDPTVDGAAWGAWLAMRADRRRWRPLAEATAAWLWTQRQRSGTWRSGWFTHDEITDFLATRLHATLEPVGSPRLSELAAALLAGQDASGSFGDSVVATSARILAFTCLLEVVTPSNLIDGAMIRQAADRAIAWLQSSDATGPEPVLYYWFETRTGLPEGERLFFHAHDRGHISQAWSQWAQRSWANHPSWR